MNKPLLDKLKLTNEEIISQLEAMLPIPSGPEKRVFEAMRYASMSNGKRLRPLLVLESSLLFNVPHFQALRVATAVEMVHCYSLIHDDLPAMDNDDLRRGIPTTHKQFDEATAILAGDGLLTKAFEVLADRKTHVDAEVRSRLVLEMAKAMGPSGMVGGQMIDMSPVPEKNITIDYITRMQGMKTGCSITFSCISGAILAEAMEKDFQILSEYARCISLAFQITDDILDVEGDPALVGKTLGKDISAGKVNFVAMMGVQKAREKSEKLIKKAIEAVSCYKGAANTLTEIAQFVIDRKF